MRLTQEELDQYQEFVSERLRHALMVCPEAVGGLMIVYRGDGHMVISAVGSGRNQPEIQHDRDLQTVRMERIGRRIIDEELLHTCCRICGCNEADACEDDQTGNCYWVQEDLCSACEAFLKDGLGAYLRQKTDRAIEASAELTRQLAARRKAEEPA